MSPLLELTAVVELPVRRWPPAVGDGLVMDPVAEEAAVAIEFAGVPHVVMLATPTDLEDLAVGFTLSEQLAAGPAEILDVNVTWAEATATRAVHEPVATVQVNLPASRLAEVFRRKRNLSARSGCGLCGVETAEQWARTPQPPSLPWALPVAELQAALAALAEAQVAGRLTGSLHAAGWALPGRGLQFAREDVGRHNALVKVLGAVVRAGKNPADGYLLVTSRGSFELVQKALALGVGLLAAVSAPTAMAVRAADAGGLTLVGFARPPRHVVYTHPARLAGSAA